MRKNKSWALSFSFLALAGSLAAGPLGCGDGASGSSSGGSATGGGGAGGTAGGGTGGTGGQTCTPENEVCDGKDNNCDGVVDEGCTCTAGETQSCYAGPDGTSGVGPCKDGKQTCGSDGTWGACEGAVEPKAETCDGVDNDCNAQVDDGLGMKTCGVGACAATVPACENGQVVPCTPGTPQTEVCDGKDNDCNGVTDEADPQVGMVCMTGGSGVCAAGVFACTAGALVCGGAAMPSMELCDGLDNNCDGVVDDGNPESGAACNTGLPGVCAPGVQNCNAGALQCTQNVMAGAEACDGLDNNCNGAVDENNPGGGGACATGLPGVCAAGTKKCQNGAIACTQNVMAGNETCGDSLDNNCNGAVDEGCSAAGVIYMTSSNGSSGFYGYNIATNAWATLPNPPVVTYSEITTDGSKVLLLGQNNIVYSYNPATSSWAAGQTGPSAAESSSPIGFFKWTPNGLYYLKDGTSNLKRSVAAGAWTTVVLPAAGSCAGTYDPASGRLYIRDYGNFGLTVFNTVTNTLVSHFVNATGCGENSRTGAYYNGFFYERDFSGPFFKVDVTSGAATNTGVTPAESHTATDVDFATGKIYLGPYSPTGTVFQSYNVTTNNLTTLAPAPAPVDNHSTIVLIK